MKRKIIQRTDDEWKALFEKVNAALGIELYSWQKDVIMLRSACIETCFTQKKDICKEEILRAFNTIKDFCDSQYCEFCPLYLKEYDEEERTRCVVNRLPCSLDIDYIANKFKERRMIMSGSEII